MLSGLEGKLGEDDYTEPLEILINSANKNNEFNFFTLLSNSNLKLRRDILKVSFLSILFIFSILIIKKIFSNEVIQIKEDSFNIQQNQIKRLQKIKIRAVGEPPLFISVSPEPESGFYKVAEIKTHFANLKLCDINKSNWRRPE